MNKTLNQKQEIELKELAKRPQGGHGRKATYDALVKRGYAIRAGRNYGYAITTAGCEYLGTTKLLTDVAYAEYNLNGTGWQLRHNCRQIDWHSFNAGAELRHVWYKRSLEDEVNAVADFHNRAIELTRAEIRAGIAGK